MPLNQETKPPNLPVVILVGYMKVCVIDVAFWHTKYGYKCNLYYGTEIVYVIFVCIFIYFLNIVFIYWLKKMDFLVLKGISFWFCLY